MNLIGHTSNKAAMWAAHIGPGDFQEIDRNDEEMNVYRYSKNTSPYEVVLYRLLKTNHNISLHSYVSSNRCYGDIWEFFSRHIKNTH